MTCACCANQFDPLTEAEALTVMRTWLFQGNMTFYPASGGFHMLAMSPPADNLAARLVISGYGIRRHHAIMLNAGGIALWDQAHL